MSQYADKTQNQFAKINKIHDSMETLTPSMDKTVKNLQGGHAQLRKASEETKKRVNLVFEEQHHSKRDRDCLDQDIKNCLMSTIAISPNHKAMLWIIHITNMTSNQMPC
ncbi:hypothetical protein O181_021818 [Austropuccinia psidii MF-1]|uniref:Uncharacterized protein n=1 Tax=Austropuccinia psidii MF-1 TaxID=1389203 RepID=A0A9Q3CE18_9BASI|nr:hypothetical protein [Austropuccinia psidii MF-1]